MSELSVPYLVIRPGTASDILVHQPAEQITDVYSGRAQQLFLLNPPLYISSCRHPHRHIFLHQPFRVPCVAKPQALYAPLIIEEVMIFPKRRHPGLVVTTIIYRM